MCLFYQRQFYAAYNTTGAGLVVHGIIPIPFQNCTEGLSGCLFEYDDPDKQCSEGRHGKEIVQLCRSILCAVLEQSLHAILQDFYAADAWMGMEWT